MQAVIVRGFRSESNEKGSAVQQLPALLHLRVSRAAHCQVHGLPTGRTDLLLHQTQQLVTAARVAESAPFVHQWGYLEPGIGPPLFALLKVLKL
jgi:hypothetical protein